MLEAGDGAGTDRAEVVVEGKSIDQALEKASRRLGLAKNRLGYDVLETRGGGGLLGFLKGRTYKLKVWKKSEGRKILSEIVGGIIERMGLDAKVSVSEDAEGFEVHIETSDADGLLIGRGGETLTAMQHLISRMAARREEGIRVRLDVGGYRRRRVEQLEKKAKELAEQAQAWGRDVLTEPLPAAERRIVHLALADDDRVETKAVGEEPLKRVAVIPVKPARARGGRMRERSQDRQGSRRSGSRGDGRPGGARGRGERAWGERRARRTGRERGRQEGRDGVAQAAQRSAGPESLREALPQDTSRDEDLAGARVISGEEAIEREEAAAARGESADSGLEAQPSPKPKGPDTYFRIPDSLLDEPGEGGDEEADQGGAREVSNKMSWGRTRKHGGRRRR